MTAAKASAINIPFWPPKARPASMSSSVMPVSSSVVLNMLLMIVASVLLAQSIRCRVLGLGLLWLVWGRAPSPIQAERSSAAASGLSAGLALALQRPVQGLVEGGSGFFVILGRDLALFFFYL